ncbi:N-alpha-acetyl diaminobutyric acid deacetylase DoeB [Rhodobacteraceae bacterium WD3A24]|nr:N-alpha-acetyl diaminobutyric acid deacetylase DoeB [Rhodobacteraceae bacterium WD3A24]
MARSPVTPTIPLDAKGIHHGHLRLPHSRDDSAWGSVMIPITVIRGAPGPTALMTAGNHGDEYEGQLALRQLALELDADAIAGCVIMLPAMNLPAVRAATRTSPIDRGNLNRLFPGRPDGSVTEKIAHYVATELVPRADLVLDYHSGGRTLDFLPFAAAHVLEDKAQEAACIAAMEAFNAPWSMIMLEIDSAGMFDTEVEGQGKVFVTTELGGGGTATARSVAIARKGARNILEHMGILDGAPEIGPTAQLDMPDARCFHFAEAGGLFEPLVDLGDDIAEGARLARIWPVERCDAEPSVLRARRGGILVSRHFPGLVQPGDCVGVVAERVDKS